MKDRKRPNIDRLLGKKLIRYKYLEEKEIGYLAIKLYFEGTGNHLTVRCQEGSKLGRISTKT
jgi:hypothetical protein